MISRRVILPAFVSDLLSTRPYHGKGKLHGWIFRLACVLHPYRDENEIYEILRAALIDCGRPVPDQELRDAIRNSRQSAWYLYLRMEGQDEVRAVPSAT